MEIYIYIIHTYIPGIVSRHPPKKNTPRYWKLTTLTIGTKLGPNIWVKTSNGSAKTTWCVGATPKLRNLEVMLFALFVPHIPKSTRWKSDEKCVCFSQDDSPEKL